VIAILFVSRPSSGRRSSRRQPSLNLFARDFTDRKLWGFEIPATWFQSVNSFFIFLCAPFFAAIWVGMAKRGGNFSSPAKFAMGLFFAGLGFVVMIFASYMVLSSNGAIKVSPWWL